MTSKEAIKDIKEWVEYFANWKNLKHFEKNEFEEAISVLEKDLEVLERYRQIDAIINNSSLTKCTLPNGKVIHTDIGYVEDFWNDIKEWIEEESCKEEDE